MTNTFAGMGSHQSRRSLKDEWLTPPEIVSALGRFDLDPCSPVNRPWDTADHHLTIEDDGLTTPWWGRVWMNPPYGRMVEEWIRKLAAHNHGTALIFARTETSAWFPYIWHQAAALHFFHGRLNFHHVSGQRADNNAGAPSVLIAYGQEDADRLYDAGFVGKFVPLQLPRLIAIALAGEPATWREVVAQAMPSHGPVKLDDLYGAIAGHPKTRSNKHWRAKVRQVLQRGDFRRCGNGIWEVA
ncbi:DNA N-6-adenine-methyltransferase [Parvibaculaceae bacterium PLY_AMNH_Bact1]|nr:DNA N-6-adenine-methyltransferase [Parvibaculaceae bacterium PLY_AMNH_Bact1]